MTSIGISGCFRLESVDDLPRNTHLNKLAKIAAAMLARGELQRGDAIEVGGFGYRTEANSITITGKNDMAMDAQPILYVAFKDEAMPRKPVDVILDDIVIAIERIIPLFDGFF